MSETLLIRDFFSESLVHSMADNILNVYPGFKKNNFTKEINSVLKNLSFKERNWKIFESLDKYLPNDFTLSSQIILKSFPDINFKNNWSSFYYMPFGTYVAEKGCVKQSFDISMNLLLEITQRFTAEFAIRPFLIHFPNETLAVLHQWKNHHNEHVRRLVSEGSRPRLPWAPKIPQFIKDPKPLFDLLSPLMEDEAIYVKKSVSNHLNDISKDNPALLLDFLEVYKKSKNINTQWIVKQALRSLIKKGDFKALAILGYQKSEHLVLDKFEVKSTKVKIGEELKFEFSLVNKGDYDQEVLIDYVLHYQKANGKLAPKVFKLTQKTIKVGEVLNIQKKQSFKIITTRKFYIGKHQIQLQLNGEALECIDFELYD